VLFGQNGHLRQELQVTLPGAATGIFLQACEPEIGPSLEWRLIAAELLGVSGMGQEMNSAAGARCLRVWWFNMLIYFSWFTPLSDTNIGFHWKRVFNWRPSLNIERQLSYHYDNNPDPVFVPDLNLRMERRWSSSRSWVASGVGKSTLLRLCLAGPSDGKSATCSLHVKKMILDALVGCVSRMVV